MTTVRRLLLLLALMVWQGGFMFYGGVVVEVGAQILGSHLEQGFITQSVTNYLNAAGAVALTVWGWDIATGRGAVNRRRRWIGWGGLALLLGAQVWVHLRLDDLLVASEFRVLDRPGYRRLHQWYLGLSTIQWAGAIVMTAWSLQAWRDDDARSHADEPSRD